MSRPGNEDLSQYRCWMWCRTKAAPVEIIAADLGIAAAVRDQSGGCCIDNSQKSGKISLSSLDQGGGIWKSARTSKRHTLILRDNRNSRSCGSFEGATTQPSNAGVPFQPKALHHRHTLVGV